ncbi:MAG: undecaprenyl/decaprenyl-phosphate alpha-N-acetylglucosaminyl 1-phosphate transferase [Clostridia bacterium]|nr:undecaprenyl/decaprenyl-phosphate alpha-N-acetylglucosaminyl 1-phosphate transferase [Clostridia bacterium]
MNEKIVFGLASMVCAALIAFSLTPSVRVLAHRIGAIDIPKDDRRMHKIPIPRLGGLAIYLAFTLTTLIFAEITPLLKAMWIGGTMIVIVGMLDDVFRLKAVVKLIFQIAVAFIAVWQGIIIDHITIFGRTLEFNSVWSIVVTVFWIVGLTNAINLIDGLDGLSCGISAICSMSLLLVTLLKGEDPACSLLTAILTASCLGFLPFNINPAKIFMGDTGALFLGYSLSLISIGGLFKFHAVMSFLVPLSIFGLPLFDTAFAIVRRLIHGKSPFEPDRGHLHHRLMDMGLNQKQSVYILYSICGILGLSAIMFTSENLDKAIITIAVGFVIFILDFIILKNPGTKEESGIDEMLHNSKEENNMKAERENKEIPPSEGKDGE